MDFFRAKSDKARKTKFAQHLRKHMTPAEKRLWQVLRCRRLGVLFRRQSLVLGYIADFYSPRAKLVVEADGSSHDGRQAYDATRDAAMRRFGLTVLRFSNDVIFHNLSAVRAQIKNMLAIPR